MILWRLGGTEELLQDGARHRDGVAARRPRAPRRRCSPSSTTARTRRSTASRAGCADHWTSQTHEARLLFAYTHANPPLLAASQGNMQTLAGREHVVGYGGVPAISEYAAGGSLLFDAHLPFDMSFYRAFRFPWAGRPATPPAVVASLNDTGEETIVHASWNGASEVASWRVLAGPQAGSLSATPRSRTGLRELDHAAAEVRLRGGAGARLRRAGARRPRAPRAWSATRPRSGRRPRETGQ